MENRRKFVLEAGAAALSGAFAFDARKAGAKVGPSTGNTHVSAPTRYLETNGVRYAYRRFGAASGVPLIFIQHYRGGMDHWDPLITDGFAAGRPVILFDTAGLAGSSGVPPTTIDATADDVATFVNGLAFKKVDVLGFSIGGSIGQTLALRHPELVRRLILAGTGPRNGEPAKDPRIRGFADDPNLVMEDFLYLFFSPSEASQAAGKAFWARRHLRTKDVDPPSSPELMKAQTAASVEWRQPRGERFADIRATKQPTLVVNGNNDIMVPTINAFYLSQNIPNSMLILYPDAGHGAIFQYPKLFLSHSIPFLDGA